MKFKVKSRSVRTEKESTCGTAISIETHPMRDLIFQDFVVLVYDKQFWPENMSTIFIRNLSLYIANVILENS